MSTDEKLLDVAVVAIGRNEGERLRACLASVVQKVALTVYVDSGSTDNSKTIAENLGAVTVDLDTSIPFTAARARNAGFKAALEHLPDLEWIQFVDGDCEVQPDWLSTARDHLRTHDGHAIVFGRRRERFPERSVYNEMCDIEWDVQPGIAKYCGGDIMARVSVVKEIGGYRESLIAGEEPEMCVRIRAAGWKIEALPAEMTLHDANMTHFTQWWRRVMRSGWAYAAGAHLHGAPPEKHWVKQSRQAWLWVGLPFAVLLIGLPVFGIIAFLVLLVYPLQWLRLYLTLPGSFRQRAISSSAFTLGRFPEFFGQLKYWYDYLLNNQARLIEYK
ncbi:MAG: glycosyltransferase family 2 protein [Pseudomonadaceae bacterium]|nr:glycosyltransferase family 2 protein [Pseudomonadaceae bacterium]